MKIGEMISGIFKIDSKKAEKPKEPPKKEIPVGKEFYSTAAGQYSKTIFTADQNIQTKADTLAEENPDMEPLTAEEKLEDHNIKVTGYAGSVLATIYTNYYKEELTPEDLAEKEVFDTVAGAEEGEIIEFLEIAKEARGKLEEVAAKSPIIFDEKTVKLGHQYLNEVIRLLEAGIGES